MARVKIAPNTSKHIFFPFREEWRRQFQVLACTPKPLLLFYPSSSYFSICNSAAENICRVSAKMSSEPPISTCLTLTSVTPSNYKSCRARFYLLSLSPSFSPLPQYDCLSLSNVWSPLGFHRIRSRRASVPAHSVFFLRPKHVLDLSALLPHCRFQGKGFPAVDIQHQCPTRPIQFHPPCRSRKTHRKSQYLHRHCHLTRSSHH